MPVHSKHTTQRLKPKRVGKTREQLRRPVMKEEVFGNGSTELGHPLDQSVEIAQPRRDLLAKRSRLLDGELG